ncbi:MAG: hypothetical protein DRO04_00155 [Candidatus Iainarchaeum archaeon]|uniref:Uncharacterized protein n=1 Tax=Candidatus Iainarchaeum sp. TaxID=3101447 RepID=A0A497JI63_9ARCH|nr:MAG: hypothetical protein DRO04_00155 [Candidatus Diapherotrites archaeon]
MAKKEEIERLKEEIFFLVDSVLEDPTVPRNIKNSLNEAKEKLENYKDVTNVSLALYILDDLNNDPNMPPHTRTELWKVISKLEELKEKIKK